MNLNTIRELTTCVILGISFTATLPIGTQYVAGQSLASRNDLYITRTTSNIPKRTEFNVSVTNDLWQDSLRSRSIPVTVYYPTIKSKYQTNYSHESAEVASDQRYPLVIYSHGLGAEPHGFEYLARAWARHGIITVLVRHVGSDDTVWRGKLRPMHHLTMVYEREKNASARIADLRFALCRIAQLDLLGRFVAPVDMQQVGLAGNDLGALAAMKMEEQQSYEQMQDSSRLQQEFHISAIVAMSPPVAGHTVDYDAIRAACLFITGTEDDGVVGNTKAFQRRIPFDNVDTVKYLMTLTGADHMVYSGHAMPGRRRQDARYQNTIAQLSAQFWDAYLNHATDALVKFEGTASPQDGLSLSTCAGRLERGSLTLCDLMKEAGSENETAQRMKLTAPTPILAPVTVKQSNDVTR